MAVVEDPMGWPSQPAAGEEAGRTTVQAEEPLSESEVEACALGTWYSSFRDVTFKTEVIPLTEDFVQFLLADGIRLAKRDADAASSDGSWGNGGGSESSFEDGVAEASFPELEETVRAAIQTLNGRVLPKLNWSAPKDAQWIQGTLCCTTPDEVFTLLKASDFISHDLCHSFDLCNTTRTRPDRFTLVLRRWHSLLESGEFRCYVSNSSLVAVSQRNTSCLFEHLATGEERDAVLVAISDFFEQRVSSHFPLQRYAFDVYVDIPPRRRVWIVDFSPWCASTDPCLYDWDELGSLFAASGGEVPEFRFVSSEAERRTKLESYHNLPVELAQLKSGQGLDELLAKADQVLKEKEREDQR